MWDLRLLRQVIRRRILFLQGTLRGLFADASIRVIRIIRVAKQGLLLRGWLRLLGWDNGLFGFDRGFIRILIVRVTEHLFIFRLHDGLSYRLFFGGCFLGYRAII